MLQYPNDMPEGGTRIAFYGPMASGKTYLADNLFEKRHKESLAKPIKEIARDLYAVSGKTNEERQILQELADDLKKWDNNVFTKLLLYRLKYYYSPESSRDKERLPVVLDDLRFKHEADDLRKYGFIIIRVSVPEDVRLARIAEKYPDTDPARFTHVSEQDYVNIYPDLTVDGYGDRGLLLLRTLFHA